MSTTQPPLDLVSKEALGGGGGGGGGVHFTSAVFSYSCLAAYFVEKIY